MDADVPSVSWEERRLRRIQCCPVWVHSTPDRDSIWRHHHARRVADQRCVVATTWSWRRWWSAVDFCPQKQSCRAERNWRPNCQVRSASGDARNDQQITRIRREKQPKDQEGSSDDVRSALALVKVVARSGIGSTVAIMASTATKHQWAAREPNTQVIGRIMAPNGPRDYCSLRRKMHK